MTCCSVDWLSRQRFLIVIVALTSFMVQDFADGWRFPKRQTKITIPFDFPLHLPFYRIATIADILDNTEDFPIEFTIQRIRTHVGNATDSRPVRVKPLVDIGERNGTIWLIRRPTDLKLLENLPHGKHKYHILVNITVGGQTKAKISTKKTEILLELSGYMTQFCQPSEQSCFMNNNNKYFIPEENPDETVFEYLQNPSYASLCVDSNLIYAVTSGENVVKVNEKTGESRLSGEVDMELGTSFPFQISCSTSIETFLMQGLINYIDINNNPPLLQDGNTSRVEIRHLKPGENWVSFDVSVVDKDTKEVNDLVVRIEDDILSLFKVRNIKIYEILSTGRNTYFYAEIVPQQALSFPGEYYNFTVIIEDKSYIYRNGSVNYKFSVINRTEPELPFKDIYSLNISRSASQYSRLIQFTKNNSTKRFRFSIGSKDYDWLGITEHTGIVYIRDPLLMPTGVKTRRVIWSLKNETSNEGSILLVISVEDKLSSFCGEGMWCSYNSKKETCITSCGKGSNIGRCVWRSGSITYSGLRPDYSTCSPDFSYCPDGQCDELEQIEPTLCPQDCARQVTGEATIHSNGQGILAAIGTCNCQTVERCKCVREYPPPGEMRRPNMYRKGRFDSPPPFLNINGSFIDDNIMMEIGRETTPPSDFITSLTGTGVCGSSCILIIAIILPLVLIVLIIILIITIKSVQAKGLVKHKFVGGSHISLSAVPSDYVEERSNSIPDSRNTPTESASFGKMMVDSKWEFPRNRLQFICVLGEGEFGKVMKADAWNIAGNKGYSTVAVKMLKENGGTAERQDLYTEFLLLKEISHPNVIKLLGASLEKSGEFFLIVEYAEMGSLKNYLRKKRRHNSCCRNNEISPTKQEELILLKDYYQFPCERSRREPKHSYFHKEQISFAWQIAKGMAYLSDLKLVHRDLATRNILLAKQKVVKISDFGLSRDVYEGETYLKRSKGKVPIKWMAIESMEDQIYTSRSDVWSFGIVLWEIMMNGASPYPGVTPQRLFHLLKAGYRMTKPDFCPDEAYLLMRQCWRTLPRERPSFKEIVLKLDFILQDTVEYMDFVPKSKFLRPDEIMTTSNETPWSINYTTVLLEDEEDEIGEGNENIGLVNLFEQSI